MNLTFLDAKNKVWVLFETKLGECYVYSPEDEPFLTAKRPEKPQYNLSQSDLKALIKLDKRLLNELVDKEWEIVSRQLFEFEELMALFEEVYLPRHEIRSRLLKFERRLAK